MKKEISMFNRRKKAQQAEIDRLVDLLWDAKSIVKISSGDDMARQMRLRIEREV